MRTFTSYLIPDVQYITSLTYGDSPRDQMIDDTIPRPCISKLLRDQHKAVTKKVQSLLGNASFLTPSSWFQCFQNGGMCSIFSCICQRI